MLVRGIAKERSRAGALLQGHKKNRPREGPVLVRAVIGDYSEAPKVTMNARGCSRP